MKFEFDYPKSFVNLEKHGIDFDQAQRLWLGEIRIMRSLFPDEERFLVTGTIDGVWWTAIVTERDGVTRIISVRRARDEEKF